MRIRSIIVSCSFLLLIGCGDSAPGTDAATDPPPQTDGSTPDAALPDAATPDAALPDAATPDAALPDAALPDAALPDAAIPDAAFPDAAFPDASPVSFTVTNLGAFPPFVHGMVIAADDGRLFFSDTYGGFPKRVYYLLPPYTGAPQATPISGPQPAGLYWENDELYVCDTTANTVTRYDDTTFTMLEQWQADTPWNVARAANGDLLTVSFADEVQRLVSGSPAVTLFQGLEAPFDLQPLADGTLWVSEQGSGVGAPGRVTHRDLTGAVIEQINYPWENPEGLALTSDGVLWVAETERDEIIRFHTGILEVAATGQTLAVVITPESATTLLFNLASGGSLRRVTVNAP